jgi:hypothetical protein
MHRYVHIDSNDRRQVTGAGPETRRWSRRLPIGPDEMRCSACKEEDTLWLGQSE